MKFKVGDIVRFINKEPIREDLKGKKCRVIKVNNTDEYVYNVKVLEKTKSDVGIEFYWKEEWLKPIKNNIIKI